MYAFETVSVLLTHFVARQYIARHVISRQSLLTMSHHVLSYSDIFGDRNSHVYQILYVKTRYFERKNIFRDNRLRDITF
jgi:hypothetical protein